MFSVGNFNLENSPVDQNTKKADTTIQNRIFVIWMVPHVGEQSNRVGLSTNNLNMTVHWKAKTLADSKYDTDFESPPILEMSYETRKTDEYTRNNHRYINDQLICQGRSNEFFGDH